MNKSRLFVFQLKEIIYTLIFIILAIILIIVLFNMFVKKDATKETTSYNVTYNPGVYSSQLKLNNQYVNLDVTVDAHNIKSISVTNLSDTVSAMYPLLEPSIEYIEKQLASGTPLSDIKYDDDSKYTQVMLVEAISSTLSSAIVHD